MADLDGSQVPLQEEDLDPGEGGPEDEDDNTVPQHGVILAHMDDENNLCLSIHAKYAKQNGSRKEMRKYRSACDTLKQLSDLVKKGKRELKIYPSITAVMSNIASGNPPIQHLYKALVLLDTTLETSLKSYLTTKCGMQQ